MAISKEEHKARYELYLKGYSDPQIGKELFISKDTVRYWRMKNKLPTLIGKGNKTKP